MITQIEAAEYCNLEKISLWNDYFNLLRKQDFFWVPILVCALSPFFFTLGVGRLVWYDGFGDATIQLFSLQLSYILRKKGQMSWRE